MTVFFRVDNDIMKIILNNHLRMLVRIRAISTFFTLKQMKNFSCPFSGKTTVQQVNLWTLGVPDGQSAALWHLPTFHNELPQIELLSLSDVLYVWHMFTWNYKSKYGEYFLADCYTSTDQLAGALIIHAQFPCSKINGNCACSLSFW